VAVALRCSNSTIMAVRAYSAANTLIYSGFANIRAQTGGGTAHLSVAPSDFIGNLQGRQCLHADFRGDSTQKPRFGLVRRLSVSAPSARPMPNSSIK
jgi:hypothetical protein